MIFRKNFLHTQFFYLLFLLSVFCPSAFAEKPLVLVSVPPQEYFVERIAGDAVQVLSLIPPTANHGMYEPDFQELKAASKARLYLKIGHPGFSFEQEWIGRLTKDNPELKVVNTSVGIQLLDHDPHTWVSPQTVESISKTTLHALQELLPERGQEFEKNWLSFQNDLKKLEDTLSNLFQATRRKEFLVLHPAWGYLARQYHLIELSIETEGKEPDPSSFARIIKAAKSAGIQTVFGQPQHSASNAEFVAKEIGAKVKMIDCFRRDWLTNTQEAATAIAESLTEQAHQQN